MAEPTTLELERIALRREYVAFLPFWQRVFADLDGQYEALDGAGGSIRDMTDAQLRCDATTKANIRRFQKSPEKLFDRLDGRLASRIKAEQETGNAERNGSDGPDLGGAEQETEGKATQLGIHGNSGGGYRKIAARARPRRPARITSARTAAR